MTCFHFLDCLQILGWKIGSSLIHLWTQWRTFLWISSMRLPLFIDDLQYLKSEDSFLCLVTCLQLKSSIETFEQLITEHFNWNLRIHSIVSVPWLCSTLFFIYFCNDTIWGRRILIDFAFGLYFLQNPNQHKKIFPFHGKIYLNLLRIPRII